jgi:zinc/manganese transport system substrate-binding protein
MRQVKHVNKAFLIVAAAVIVVAAVVVGAMLHSGIVGSKRGVVQVVAAENFWGSLASQVGGNRVHVISVVSDPNADPHEYESNTATARAFAAANYIILNGVGYDSWGNKLISASPNPARKILTVATLLGKKDGDNPHFWYSPTYVNRVVAQIEQDYITLRPADKGYFEQQYRNLQASLSAYQGRIVSIKKQFGGTKVAATEDVFQYLASAAGLDLVSPPAFIEAVAEGNDPPTDSVVTFQQQLESGQVKVLVYNEQTVTPITKNIKKLAADQGIPLIGITETVQPPDTSFQVWMNTELINLDNALNANALGQ